MKVIALETFDMNLVLVVKDDDNVMGVPLIIGRAPKRFWLNTDNRTLHMQNEMGDIRVVDYTQAGYHLTKLPMRMCFEINCPDCVTLVAH